MSIIFLTEKCPCGSGKKFINCCFRLHHKYQKIYPPAKSITKNKYIVIDKTLYNSCLLYTSDAADDPASVDLGGRRIIKKIFFKQKTAYEIPCRLVGSEMCIRDSRNTP